jgi:hypothetical protein
MHPVRQLRTPTLVRARIDNLVFHGLMSDASYMQVVVVQIVRTPTSAVGPTAGISGPPNKHLDFSSCSQTSHVFTGFTIFLTGGYQLLFSGRRRVMSNQALLVEPWQKLKRLDDEIAVLQTALDKFIDERHANSAFWMPTRLSLLLFDDLEEGWRRLLFPTIVMNIYAADKYTASRTYHNSCCSLGQPTQ